MRSSYELQVGVVLALPRLLSSFYETPISKSVVGPFW